MKQPPPDRRHNPRLHGMVVTQPGEFYADLAHHVYTCDQLGVCQDRSDCTCTRSERAAASATEAGNVWFVGIEPNIDETAFDTGWPLTPREVLHFWLFILAAVAVYVSAVLLAVGWVAGLDSAEVLGSVLAWGL